MVEEDTRRRLIERCFSVTDAREMFNLDNDEIFLDVCYDKGRNKIVVTSLTDFNKRKGDI